MVITFGNQSNTKSSKLYRVNNNLPSWLHHKPKKYIKYCGEKLKMVKEIFKEQNLTRENKKFVVKNATSKDVKYNVFFGDEHLWTDCDCVE